MILRSRKTSLLVSYFTILVTPLIQYELIENFGLIR